MTDLRPDDAGRFGRFGGRFVPEALMHALAELETAFEEAQADDGFRTELARLLRDYAGRPTSLWRADRLTEHAGGARIYLKREDLAHTGAHKVNNVLGQCLLTKRMGKPRVIAETGAGQHGVATATAAALLDLECVVYMGEEDTRRQQLNVFRMEQLGATVIPVTSGSRTLKDAVNEALRDWVTNVEDTHYVIGSVVGPHPFPYLVREFQKIIGEEARRQILEHEGRLPDLVVACVGGGSNAIGIFHGFVRDAEVALVGVEAGGSGIETGKHSATLGGGEPGVLHGAMSMLLQDADGQVTETHSISAGLDYPSVGPEHAFLQESGRATYTNVTDAQALLGFQTLARTEGILAALESSHAVAWAIEEAGRRSSDDLIIVNLSGRGDKDLDTIRQATGAAS